MVSFKFDRGLDGAFVERLNRMYEEGGWWTKLMDDKQLFLAIRKNYVNFYYKGASILKLSWFPATEELVGEIHYKYLVRPKLLGSTTPNVSVKDGIASIPTLRQLYLDNIGAISLIKRTANRYAGNEKSSVHYVVQRDTNKIFDLEIAFSDEDDDSSPRMDMAALRRVQEGVEIEFFEAKEFSNHKELRAKGDANPKVVDQIERYSRILRANSAAVIRTYVRVCRNLYELKGAAQRLPERATILEEIANDTSLLTINTQPRLLILGCDQDQKNGKVWRPHRDKLESKLPGRVHVIGSGKNVQLHG